MIAQIKNRNYKFIIYMDDLSFEEFEIEYKYLKAVIEGGLEKKPDNILIYATSNRRHLVREKFRDKLRSEMRRSAFLRYRSGEAFPGIPLRRDASISVRRTRKNSRTLSRLWQSDTESRCRTEELLLKANQWELHHGGLTGRTAQQFIDYLLRTMQKRLRESTGSINNWEEGNVWQ